MPTRVSAAEKPELLATTNDPGAAKKKSRPGKKDLPAGDQKKAVNAPVAAAPPAMASSEIPDPAKSSDEPLPETGPTGPVAKPQIPQGRSKSAEEEIKRLAGAAAAAGAAHAFHPEDITLPADHQKTVLPTRRTLGPTPDGELPAESGRTPTALPNRRDPVSPPSGPAKPNGPIEPKPDVEISVTPLRGPSKFVGQPTAAPAVAPVPRPVAAAPAPAAPAGQEAPKGGFRLGGGRSLHFSPVPVTDADAEAPAWGNQQESPVQAARSRRLVSIALVLVLLGLGGLGIYGLRLAFEGSKDNTAISLAGGADGEMSNEDVMRNVEDARRVLERYLAADSLDKLAAEVRHPEVTRPRMERYYKDTVIKPRKKRTESQAWSEVRIGDKEFIRAAWELDDFRIYQFNLEIIPGSDPKIDWESLVHWSEMPWKDFLKTPPEEAYEFRVNVTHEAADQYYNYSFKGQELEMMCFKLEDPEKYGSCWAYCHKDSEAASTLLFNLKRARQQGMLNADRKATFSCILRLRFPPEGRKTNQVLIEKLVHDSWVQP